MSALQLLDRRAGELHAGWIGKRGFDIVVSFILILLFLPILLATALAVKLTSRGPVFFRQRRVGRGGREFPMLKFRTMHPQAERLLQVDPTLRSLYLEADHKIPAGKDPRVTRLGRLLRASSLDELPQLFNILVGHMSLVGPRPVTAEQLVDYQEHLPAYVSLRPGLTGLWQVSGRNEVKFPARAQLDVQYQQLCSPGYDVRLLLRTPAAVVRSRG